MEEGECSSTNEMFVYKEIPRKSVEGKIIRKFSKAASCKPN